MYIRRSEDAQDVPERLMYVQFTSCVYGGSIEKKCFEHLNDM